jgi:hexulose-6-phosphate isomerase
MQGRLSAPAQGRFQSFPRDSWRQELADAPAAGIDAIEWIVDMYGDGANPIDTDSGIAELLDLERKHQVRVDSICADWFMEQRLVGDDPFECAKARKKLNWLLERSKLLGITRIVLPFVDASALSNARLLDKTVELLFDVLPLAHDKGVELHLETSLGPDQFASLLSRVEDPFIRVNYDIGNSASLGYDPREEVAAYGPRIGSVHIKDRVFGGTTVPLGSGDADLPLVFAQLGELRYAGPFVLQAARGVSGEELAHVTLLSEFVRPMIEAVRAAQP